MSRPARRRAMAIAAAVAAAVLLAVALAGGGEDERAERPAPRATATPQAAIGAADLREHLRALADAARPQGTRAAGTRGDRATAAYIEARLKAAGYRVTLQPFRVPVFRERRPPRLTLAGERLRHRRDFLALTFSGSGRAAGRARRIGLACDRPAGLRPGEVAVARRGVCFFADKARNAQAAGASALLVVSDRGAPVSASLIGPGTRIPVLAVSTTVGRRLHGRVTVAVDAVSARRETRNVIAESGPRDAPRVAMAGAHLDSVVAGPGLNDNGSGVAAVLEAAERLAGRDLPVRFGFWAAEEIGLVGSRRYVRRLPGKERRRIGAYLNLDMVGSPGAEIEVYEGEGASGRRIERALRRRLPRGAGEEDLGGGSDHSPFADAGIPVGGLFTGLDRCYHRACDDLGNVDAPLAAEAARVTAAALAELARP